ncbi:MAG: hypothetical protein U5L00_18000 [Desulfovermiculus sp.]|nr:hypothetical protein [Desulfovermiculus sp.]
MSKLKLSFKNYHNKYICCVLFVSMICITVANVCYSQDFPDFCDMLNPNSDVYATYCEGDYDDSGFSPELFSSTVGSVGRTTSLVNQYLVVETAKPRPRSSDAATRIGKMPNSIGPSLRYEDVTFEHFGKDENADIYGGTLGFAVDRDRTTYGIMIPYDHMSFDDSGIDSVDQFGGILYAKHRIPFDQNRYTLNLIGNANYMYSDVDVKSSEYGDDEVNTIGGGAGVSITKNGDVFVPTLGASYQYNHDDGDTGDYHTVKTGVNAGIYLTQQLPLNIYGIYTMDLTDYEHADEENFWDLGVELAYQISTGMELSVGYKKVLDYDDFESDQIYLGSVWYF